MFSRGRHGAHSQGVWPVSEPSARPSIHHAQAEDRVWPTRHSSAHTSMSLIKTAVRRGKKGARCTSQYASLLGTIYRALSMFDACVQCASPQSAVASKSNEFDPDSPSSANLQATHSPPTGSIVVTSVTATATATATAAAAAEVTPEPDGATVHCLSISDGVQALENQPSFPHSCSRLSALERRPHRAT
jgi:hypothetical protein